MLLPPCPRAGIRAQGPLMASDPTWNLRMAVHARISDCAQRRRVLAVLVRHSARGACPAACGRASPRRKTRRPRYAGALLATAPVDLIVLMRFNTSVGIKWTCRCRPHPPPPPSAPPPLSARADPPRSRSAAYGRWAAPGRRGRCVAKPYLLGRVEPEPVGLANVGAAAAETARVQLR